jgi:hypothetical protein
MSEHTYKSGLDYSVQLLGNAVRILGMATIAAYACAILLYVIRHFNPLLDAERSSLANMGAFVSNPFVTGNGSSSASIVVSGTFIVACVICAVYLIKYAYSWIQEIISYWEKVGSCNWWDSIGSFLHCLGDALWGFVQTVAWVLITITTVVITYINIDGLVLLI